MKLWNVTESDGVGSLDPRTDWFCTKKEAVDCRLAWLEEHANEVDEGEDVSSRVEISLVEIPTTRAALARWLWACGVKA